MQTYAGTHANTRMGCVASVHEQNVPTRTLRGSQHTQTPSNAINFCLHISSRTIRPWVLVYIIPVHIPTIPHTSRALVCRVYFFRIRFNTGARGGCGRALVRARARLATEKKQGTVIGARARACACLRRWTILAELGRAGWLALPHSNSRNCIAARLSVLCGTVATPYYAQQQPLYAISSYVRVAIALLRALEISYAAHEHIYVL